MLKEKGIVEKISEGSEWVDDLVVIEEPNGSLRICLNLNDLNLNTVRNYVQIPSLEKIRSKLSGKSVFSVFDFRDGFHQVPLDESSSKLCTFSTPSGCYKFLRMPFGLNIAPEFFQELNVKHFESIPNTVIYFNDLLIALTLLRSSMKL